MSALLTWGERVPDSDPLASGQNTVQGVVTLLKNFIDAAAALSNWHWEVASSELTTAPFQITLKPKGGGAGRILFMGVNSGPNLTFNPELGNTVSWSGANIRAAYFRGATSDTPANMLSTSGSVFTGTTSYSGLGARLSQMGAAGYVWTGWSCADGIAVRYGSSSVETGLFIVGDLVERYNGDAIAASFMMAGGTFPLPTPTATYAPNIDSYFACVSIDPGLVTGLGETRQPHATAYTYMRNNAAKKTYYTPVMLGSYVLTAPDVMGFKFRQICYGPTPLAGYESLNTTGPTLQAQCLRANASYGLWVTNFKV